MSLCVREREIERERDVCVCVRERERLSNRERGGNVICQAESVTKV